jgi:spore germination protein (amino acid permease)
MQAERMGGFMMNQATKERFLVSPFFVFFLIHGTQVGIGVLSFQRSVMKEAGHDAWIAVIITGIIAHLLIWIMYKLFAHSPNAEDIVSIHNHYFGKWIGFVFSFALLVYFSLLAFTVLQTYIEIIKIWMFPLMGAWQFSLIFLALTYYTVLGGFRVVTGLCFWGVVIPLLTIFPMLFFPLEYAHYRNLLPVFDHSIGEIFSASKAMSLQYLGMEMLIVYYAFIKQPEKSHKWAQWGNAFTTLLYLSIMLVAILFYNEEQIQHITWPTLTLAKIPEVPFIQRMEYIIISIYVLVVFPIICIAVWSASRIAKKLFSIKQRRFVPVILALLFIGALWFEEKEQIERLNKWTSTIGLYIVIFYIPALYIYVTAANKIKKIMQQKS